MLKQLDDLQSTALKELENINNIKEMESWRVCYLGRRSQLTGILRGLATLSLEEKRAAGARANQVKVYLEDRLKEKRSLQLFWWKGVSA